jgi:NAD(P)-dependent dehydrogenase (short-subunit alcohol dehydrogenase family)
VNYFGAVAMLDEARSLLASGEAPSAVAIASIGAVFVELVVPEFVEACLAGDEEAAVRAIAERDGNTAYVNAKHALALAVRQRVAEWGASGIRLNAVLPGTIETPMLDAIHAHEGLGPAVKAMPIPLGRSAQPSEIGDVIAFLLGPDARYVHGAMIHADGGADARVRPEVL